jgi:hypothetical protein
MTAGSIASEIIFCVGWVAVGAAAALSRYKKALELGRRAPGAASEGAGREYHHGLFFGRAILTETAPPVEWKPAPGPDFDAAPASLAHLARALEEEAAKARPRDLSEQHAGVRKR